ncbi:MAG: NAD(P)-binding domain-containing protein, partial [Bacteroidota bacterium]
MKIGIIGSGNIGGSVGIHLAKAGHEVIFSSRNPEKLTPLVAATDGKAKASTPEEAANFAEVILLAIPFGNVPAVAQTIGSIDGKVLIDAGNYYPQRDGAEIGKAMQEKGLLETEWTASHFSGAHVGKAFNSIYYKTLQNKAFASQADRLAIPFAAADKKAEETIQSLLISIDFAPVFLGDLTQTKIIQPNESLYTKEMSEEALKKQVKQLLG